MWVPQLLHKRGRAPRLVANGPGTTTLTYIHVPAPKPNSLVESWDSWSIADTQKQRAQEKELEKDMKVVEDMRVAGAILIIALLMILPAALDSKSYQDNCYVST